MRLPDDLIAELDAEAQERGVSRTAVMEGRLRRESPNVLDMEEAYRGLMAHVPGPVLPEPMSEPVPGVPAEVSEPAPPEKPEPTSEPVMTCPDCGARPTSPKVLAEGKCFFCRRKLVAA